MKNFICEIRIGQLTIQFGSDGVNAEETHVEEERGANSFVRRAEPVRAAAAARPRARGDGWPN